MESIYTGKTHRRLILRRNITRVAAVLWCCFATASLFAGSGHLLPEGGTGNATENQNCAEADFMGQAIADQLHAYYTRRHKLDGFNGCVLVAKDGKPLYSGAFGYGNINEKDTLTTETSFQLASVTKTFTSVAILKLVEQGKISLDDSLQRFFPEFPYHGITIKTLLCHRTGLPDYVYWGKDFIGNDVAYLTNQLVLDLLVSKKPPLRSPPDRIFIYSNTNYAILALVLESVTCLTYKEYMQDSIFTTLGMNNTYVSTIEDTGINCSATCYEARKWREWKTEFSDGVVGDKNIYSSVDDLLKWDNALRDGKVLSPEMLEEAYKPHNLDRYSFARDRSRNYGLGWRLIKQRDGSCLVFHNGNWHGCNNVFARNLKDGYTLIVLGNKSNQANYLTQPVWDIITRMKNMQNVAASLEE